MSKPRLGISFGREYLRNIHPLNEYLVGKGPGSLFDANISLMGYKGNSTSLGCIQRFMASARWIV
jgi:hypothetical protein